MAAIGSTRSIIFYFLKLPNKTKIIHLYLKCHMGLLKLNIRHIRHIRKNKVYSKDLCNYYIFKILMDCNLTGPNHIFLICIPKRLFFNLV